MIDLVLSRLGVLTCLALAITVFADVPAAGPSVDAQVQTAFDYAYNLDHEQAITLLKQAAAQDPQSCPAQRALATVTWMNLLFNRGSVLVDDYLGPVTKRDVTVKPPPTEVSSAFRAYVGRAEAIAEERVSKSPNDVNAQYDLGAALGLDASWTATIEGRVMGAFSAARRAYNAHEKVLELAPARKDASLVVGTYRYLVANLSLPARWVAYMVGFGGDRERGIRMIEEAAAYQNNGTEAKFALVLIYNREHEYDKAVHVLQDLQMKYPRNRLLWLESGSTLLLARRAREADAMLTIGLEKFAKDTRVRMGGEEGLWYYKRGAARVMLQHRPEAQADLTRATSLNTRQWVQARVHLELGKLADLAGDRTRARAEYDRAIQLANTSGDGEAGDEAARLKGEAYKG
jgi:tetratricopeptide (TPR) repeat protein